MRETRTLRGHNAELFNVVLIVTIMLWSVNFFLYLLYVVSNEMFLIVLLWYWYRANNPKSVDERHALNNGLMQINVQLIKKNSKGWRMFFLEKFYIQLYQLEGPLMDEQNIGEINPLFAFVHGSNS